MYRVHNQMNTNLFWGCLLCNHSIQEVIHVLYRYQKQIHQTNLKAHSMISPKQLALKQIGYCPQRQQRFILCKILLPRMLLLIILHEAASRLFTALQLLNVWIESWENWTPAQCFALDRVDSYSLRLASSACLPAPSPLHLHLLHLLFISHALKHREAMNSLVSSCYENHSKVFAVSAIIFIDPLSKLR